MSLALYPAIKLGKTEQKIRESIAAGDYYQTNLTRKFYGKFTRTFRTN